MRALQFSHYLFRVASRLEHSHQTAHPSWARTTTMHCSQRPFALVQHDITPSHPAPVPQYRTIQRILSAWLHAHVVHLRIKPMTQLSDPSILATNNPRPPCRPPNMGNLQFPISEWIDDYMAYPAVHEMSWVQGLPRYAKPWRGLSSRILAGKAQRRQSHPPC